MILEYERKEFPAPWIDVNKAFDESFADALLSYFPSEVYSIDYDGRRSCTNDFRTFVNRDTNIELVEMFKDWDTSESREFFSEISGQDCSDGTLRIELCQDSSGFYLDKHIDIPEKYITLQVYLGEGDETWGTSIYNNNDLYHTNKFIHNTGWMSFKGSPLIHGIEKGVINGIRRSVIINYVIGDWNDTDQLYY